MGDSWAAGIRSAVASATSSSTNQRFPLSLKLSHWSVPKTSPIITFICLYSDIFPHQSEVPAVPKLTRRRTSLSHWSVPRSPPIITFVSLQPYFLHQSEVPVVPQAYKTSHLSGQSPSLDQLEYPIVSPEKPNGQPYFPHECGDSSFP